MSGHSSLDLGTYHRADDPEDIRQGLATRAFRLLIDYAHDTLGVPVLLAQMEPDNQAMIAVMEGLGFRRTDAGPETWMEYGRNITVHTWAHHAE